MNTLTKKIQQALIDHGFDVGKAGADGIQGQETEAAIIAFKKSIGFRARPFVGKLTLAKLGIKVDKRKTSDLPWINEAGKWFGAHEEDDNLKAYLASDNVAAIDPDNIPWCAAFIHQVLSDSMPDEEMPERVKLNPLLAYNYLKLGNETTLKYGAIVILWRGNRSSIKGHIAIVVGYDPVRKRIRILGGNQTDAVTYTWISIDRVRNHGYRVPSTFKVELPPVPIMNSRGAVISTNEA